MNSSLLLSSAFTGAQTGPMILGVDVVWAGTMLAAVGVFAVTGGQGAGGQGPATCLQHRRVTLGGHCRDLAMSS